LREVLQPPLPDPSTTAPSTSHRSVVNDQGRGREHPPAFSDHSTARHPRIIPPPRATASVHTPYPTTKNSSLHDRLPAPHPRTTPGPPGGG